MIAAAVPVDTSQYTAQYELLRSQVISAQGEATWDVVGQPRGVGLALLLREGMPGWLEAVEAVIDTSSPARGTDAAGSAVSQHPGGFSCPLTWLSVVSRHELTTLLTSLVLSTRPLERSSSREEYRSWH